MNEIAKHRKKSGSMHKIDLKNFERMELLDIDARLAAEL